MDIVVLVHKNGNSCFYVEYAMGDEDTLILRYPDNPCKVKAEGLLSKIQKGVGGNSTLPAVYSCEHGPVTNESFYKYSVPVSVL